MFTHAESAERDTIKLALALRSLRPLRDLKICLGT
jgi:hypothetical protein